MISPGRKNILSPWSYKWGSESSDPTSALPGCEWSRNGATRYTLHHFASNSRPHLLLPVFIRIKATNEALSMIGTLCSSVHSLAYKLATYDWHQAASKLLRNNIRQYTKKSIRNEASIVSPILYRLYNISMKCKKTQADRRIDHLIGIMVAFINPFWTTPHAKLSLW